MPKVSVFACIAAAVALAACAQTRAIVPVSMAQTGDESLTCAQLDDEIHKNQVAAANFTNEAARVEGNNKVYEVASIFAVVAAAGIDLSREDQIKMRALSDRNQYLLYLRGEKKC